MKILKNLSFVGLLIFLAINLSGCLKVEQTITLNKDGSCNLEMTYGMSKQNIEQLKTMQKLASAAANDDFNEAEAMNRDNSVSQTLFEFNEENVRKKFQELEPFGVKLEKLESETRNDWKYINVLVSFKDLDALMKTEFFNKGAFSLTKNKEGNYVFSQSVANYGHIQNNSSSSDHDSQRLMLQQLAPLLKGLKIIVNVKVPGKILESNAMQKNINNDNSDNVATWVYDLDKDPEALYKIQKSQMMVVFAGDDLSLPLVDN